MILSYSTVKILKFIIGQINIRKKDEIKRIIYKCENHRKDEKLFVMAPSNIFYQNKNTKAGIY